MILTVASVHACVLGELITDCTHLRIAWIRSGSSFRNLKDLLFLSGQVVTHRIPDSKSLLPKWFEEPGWGVRDGSIKPHADATEALKC